MKAVVSFFMTAFLVNFKGEGFVMTESLKESAIVTGPATSGIGKATALQLLLRGVPRSGGA